MHHKINKIKELIEIDNSIIFVGGIAKYFMGNKDLENVKDLDFVIKDINKLNTKYDLILLPKVKPIEERAYCISDNIQLDIFIREINEPIFTTIIDGIEIKHTAE